MAVAEAGYVQSSLAVFVVMGLYFDLSVSKSIRELCIRQVRTYCLLLRSIQL